MAENGAPYGHLGYVEIHRGKEAGFERVYVRKLLA